MWDPKVATSSLRRLNKIEVWSVLAIAFGPAGLVMLSFAVSLPVLRWIAAVSSAIVVGVALVFDARRRAERRRILGYVLGHEDPELAPVIIELLAQYFLLAEIPFIQGEQVALLGKLSCCLDASPARNVLDEHSLGKLVGLLRVLYRRRTSNPIVVEFGRSAARYLVAASSAGGRWSAQLAKLARRRATTPLGHVITATLADAGLFKQMGERL